MAEQKKEAAAPQRRPGQGGGAFGGHGLVGTGAKSKDFKRSGKRLLGLLRPHYAMIALVIALAVVSVSLSTVGPRILGQATNLLFAGVIQSKLPHGVTQAQVVAGLKAPDVGQQTIAQQPVAAPANPQ